MTWRGSTDIKDRIFGALVYLIPLFYVFPFGVYLIRQFPILEIIQIPLLPLAFIYSILGPFAGLIIFFVLFLAVVRNERISHFIRFNTMQAILIDILLFLIGLVLSVIGRGLQGTLLVETLYNVIFLGTLAACGYSIVQSLRGHYAEIPQLSEAVYSQVR
ncbi:MAG: Tic20 family protein [Oscillatoria sp. PMC 1051.18]|nr:Tic20 family protein [Oscillatoria sp. PMC 1050.18]MEC5030294.1 Tic20 family protein [Oscillatoria sp. PMC 1051.18]